MAKNVSPIFKFQGTVDKVTYVNSRTYGPHTRMERGTYTPIKLNKTMKKCKDLLMNCNKQAKGIFNALKDETRDGSLWWRLLAIFFKRAKEGLKADVSMLAGLECDVKHKLSDTLSTNYTVSVERRGKTMQVTVRLDESPKKNDAESMTHYRLHVVVLYPAFPKSQVRKEIAASEPTLFGSDPGPLEVEVASPSANAPYVLLLGITGYSYIQKQYYEVASYRGLKVVKTG